MTWVCYVPDMWKRGTLFCLHYGTLGHKAILLPLRFRPRR